MRLRTSNTTVLLIEGVDEDTEKLIDVASKCSAHTHSHVVGLGISLGWIAQKISAPLMVSHGVSHAVSNGG
jgi:hypothetical protein